MSVPEQAGSLDPEITLIIETGDGVLMRRVQPARGLSTDVEHGIAAEDATREAAALRCLQESGEISPCAVR